MKLPLSFIFTLAISLTLNACTVNEIRHNQLSLLDKGMPQYEVITKLNHQPISSHSMTVSNRKFLIDRYFLNSGIYADAYFLAYENEKLLYWGFINEFKRQPDKPLELALRAALDEIKTTESKTK